MDAPRFPDGPLHLDPAPLAPALDRCLVCGPANTAGLRLRWHRLLDPSDAVLGVGASVTVPPAFQGYDGLAHGGMACALVDDAMWWAVYVVSGHRTVTADLQLVYRAPVAVETPLVVEGIAAGGRRVYATAARIRDASGGVLLEASARFVLVPTGGPPRMAR